MWYLKGKNMPRCISCFTKSNEKQWYLLSVYLLVTTYNCSPEYYDKLLSLAIPLDIILIGCTELYTQITCSRWGQVNDRRYRIMFVSTNVSWMYRDWGLFFCQFGSLMRSSGTGTLTNSCPPDLLDLLNLPAAIAIWNIGYADIGNTDRSLITLKKYGV